MLISIFLAKAFGIYFIIIAVALALNKRDFLKIASEMTPLTYSTLSIAIFTLLLGIVLVLFHNVWVADWRVGITILAWVTLLKGIMLLIYPHYVYRFSVKIFNDRTYKLYVMILILLGVFFAYKGFL